MVTRGKGAGGRRDRVVIWGRALGSGAAVMLLAVGCSGDLGESEDADANATSSRGSDTSAADVPPPVSRASDDAEASGDDAASSAADGDSSPEATSPDDLMLSSEGGDDGASSAPDADSAMDEPASDEPVETEVPPAETDEPAVSPGETGIFEGVTEAHNAFRSELGLPDLVWSDELAAVAQDWSDTLASQCGVIQHRAGGTLGENIAVRGSSFVREPYAASEAVASWAAEVACWDYGSIQGTERCDAQCAADLSASGCGHYTQVVWETTAAVGCGYSTCEDGGFTLELWVCNYDPPGNIIGLAPY